MKLFLSIFIMCFLFSCDKGAKTPEGLIKMFVMDMAKGSISKSYFEKNAVGDFQKRVLDLSDEDFNKFTTLNVSNPKVKILSKSCEGDKCSISYVVSYAVKKKDIKQFNSEVKKIAEVIKEDNQWKLQSVSNVKTYYESTEPIDTLNQ